LAEPSLHPFAPFQQKDPTKGYPERLHALTLQGYFGEIFAGIVAENFSPFGENNWEVPAFLFRFHHVAFQWKRTVKRINYRAKLPDGQGMTALLFNLTAKGRLFGTCIVRQNAQLIMILS
jgi:hypothetical protein